MHGHNVIVIHHYDAPSIADIRTNVTSMSKVNMYFGCQMGRATRVHAWSFAYAFTSYVEICSYKSSPMLTTRFPFLLCIRFVLVEVSRFDVVLLFSSIDYVHK